MRSGLAILGTISLVAGCDQPNRDTSTVTVGAAANEPSSKQARPVVTIETDEILGGVFVTVEAETVVSGQRPKLVLVCGGSRAPSFQFYLKHEPASPPPLRGVHGTFTLDNGPPQEIELGWHTNDGWGPRDGEEPKAARLVRQFIAGRQLQLVPPAAYSNGVPIRWNAATLSTWRAEVRRRCR